MLPRSKDGCSVALRTTLPLFLLLLLLLALMPQAVSGWRSSKDAKSAAKPALRTSDARPSSDAASAVAPQVQQPKEKQQHEVSAVVAADEKQGNEAAEKWDCNRPWPDLELFLPINTRHHTRTPDRDNEYFNIYLRSLLMFWPLKLSKTKLFFLADEEEKFQPHTHTIHKQLLDVVAPHVPAGVRMEYNRPLAMDRSRGHDRQQRLMFYADLYSTSEYVGFVDTDCMFVTYVDREDIFENGKPVVIGRIGNFLSSDNGPGYDWWARIPQTTYSVLGVKEPMRCMSYFPVVVKTSHIRAMREYMEKRHQKKFDDVFASFMERPYSQFNIMCAYLFAFHREDYVWYVNDISPKWDYQHPPPVAGQETNASLYTPAMRFPKPRVGIHTNYWSPAQQHLTERDAVNNLRNGFCLGPPFPKAEYPACDFYRTDEQHRTVVYGEMFQYEQVDWTRFLSQEDLRLAMYRRFQRIRDCNHTYIHPNLKALVKS